MKLRILLSAFFLWVATHTATPADAQCARVRKNWSALSAQEKTTYIGAVQSAMDSGAYARLIEMHIDMMSEMEAHQQCMFIYWHRLFVLVFENMLRGQGAQYACVSVPYWDWITDHSRYISGQCRSMGDCSSTLQDLGGVPTGMRWSRSPMYGYGVDGFCVPTNPLNHFCETAARCTRCVPRGNWNAIAPPAATSYASVMSQIFSASSIGQMSPQLETGAHGYIHADLEGAMATLLSPADPIFWSHHSMVDVLHVIFHKCRVGTARMTFAQKASHPVAWSSCARRNGGAFQPTDAITMRTGGGSTGRAIVAGAQDPLLSRFFQGVPTRFADLMDTQDLGYTYELSGVTATMYSQCGGSNAPAPQPARAPQPAPIPAPATAVAPQPAPVPAPATAMQPSSQSWTFTWRRSLRTAGGFTADSSSDATRSAKVKPANSESIVVMNSAKQVALPPPTTEPVTIVETAPDTSVQKVDDWYNAMVSAVGGSSPTALEQVERMMCVYQDECLGGARDFSAEFKQTWGVGTARCKAIVDDVRSGKTRISVSDWKPQMTTRFGCPIPVQASSNFSNSPVQKSA